MHSNQRLLLAFAFASCAATSALTSGCAGVKDAPLMGPRGTGGAFVTPPIDGLMSLEVMPPTQTLALTQSGTALSGMATYTAIGHMKDGTTMDVTSKVGWPSSFKALRVSQGVATVSAPGTYTITAASGSIMATAQLVASFSGDFTADGFDPGTKTKLDGSPTGSVNIAYPLEGAIFPSNLNPLYVHVTKNGGETAARLNFTSDNVNVNYYGPCETADAKGMPYAGSGCYVKLPVYITQLFIAVSDLHDVKLTARVGGGSTLAESSNTVNIAWANVPLSGGLYYWTTMTDNAYPGYTRPKDAMTGKVADTGTGIQRYDFGKDGDAAPELVYTDQGTPPTFGGSPASPASDGGQGTCIGCHAISNDGKKMALSINGSNAGGFALLDIAAKSLMVVNTAAGTNNMTNLRIPNFAAVTTWGPNNDYVVNMYQSKLYLTPIAGTMLAHSGEVVPSWSEYKGDPFWSQDGKYLVFTSFDMPDMGMYNDTGLNGDMKRRGQIVIATAEDTQVHDDAKVLVARQSGVTSYYPVISNDSKLIAFVRSTCGSDPDVLGSGYGSQSCDGYDDSTGQLWLTAPDGRTAINLGRANGSGSNDNSWPRWSPDNGMFRGQHLYWLAFSTRRPYGLQANTGGLSSSKPQIWLAAILTGSEVGGDPSYAPVWLPNQNPVPMMPNGNHVPQWVKVAIVIPG